jgi:bifunctional DNA-binding transcriptional regulator/antitoxin component of YhaV-PrlF toxin-antitoxin module
MEVVTVSPKYQVVIPKKVRQALKIHQVKKSGWSCMKIAFR